ncbi:Concanavalin A-like lectin/glucanase, subgroup [Cynara cardunculus var. scolymus]|uniref:Concanavalin A-like lectin/glucanase, subgroup n=1 Tax=Cynara cardunculus var. scolymus TaxID=59895 RepID=A0A103Y009_CYNCS|nr:Concanavalin A-like lectin/glucanase, subgroup [Cynara cardunculus var. scolymus]
MRTDRFFFFFLLFFSVLVLNSMDITTAQIPGFTSLDCGGQSNFTDELGLDWTPDNQIIYGITSNISVTNETRQQYQTVRYFPADSRKYCYTLDVKSRTRYLIRATFLYGNFDSNNVYPKFDISMGPTRWATIVISDANIIESQELIFLASGSTISVCLSNATTGQPFISTLELRPFNGSIYLTPYPDDPFDRIWQSDLVKKANYLVDVAAGTDRVSTELPIDTGKDEQPPQKVMQTAVVGRNGTLTYRMNLDGFPGFGWAYTYFTEIEDLAPTETRKFRLVLPGAPDLSKPIVNIQENAQGTYRLYEPGFENISLPFVLSFKFGKTSDSTQGPLVNAIEISKYLKISDGSFDGAVAASLVSVYESLDWAQEGGDPCLPVAWSWWLDGNALTGPIPDFTGCPNLKIIHLENNQLSGDLPSSYVQNNLLSGEVPSGLLNKNFVLNYTGNVNLSKGSSGGRRNRNIIIGLAIGAIALFLGFITSLLVFYVLLAEPKHGMPVMSNAATEAAQCFTLSELRNATKNFEKKVGSGGFGTVYYGKLNDGKEIAVKLLESNNVYQGKKEFANEAKLHIENGDIQGIIDPALGNEYDIQSMWKIAEKALMCVQPHGNMRPSMSEVIKEIQDAISVERGAEAGARERSSDEISRHSILNMGSLDKCGNNDQDFSIDESITRPGPR